MAREKFVPIDLVEISKSLRVGGIRLGREFSFQIGEQNAAVLITYWPQFTYSHFGQKYYERLNIDTDLVEIQLNDSQMIASSGKVVFQGISHRWYTPSAGRIARVEVTAEGIVTTIDQVKPVESQVQPNAIQS